MIAARTFQKKLLTWFDAHGRKSLPWQINKTPYRVWISEIMLQQTQVATVIPYFEKFMQRFPDIFALATAHEDEVLHLWAGLGYYSRARNLHRAAKYVVETYEGHFPDNLTDLMQLPGIGQSTAGAILAIAFQQPATILDGNVKRVLSRLHGILEPINDKNTEEKLWEIAVKFTPKNRVDDYTQAIMDLGATLCTRSKPRCQTCPFQQNCTAFSQQLTHILPTKKASKTIPTRTATFLIFKKNSQIFLQKKPAQGIWGGLWSLPEIAGEPDKKSIQLASFQQFKLTNFTMQTLAPFRHTFSHYHLEIHPILIEAHFSSAKIMEASEQIWYNLAKPQSIGLPKPIQTILQRIYDASHSMPKTQQASSRTRHTAITR